MKPVCLVIGAGAGIGGNVARKFALEGYHSVLCRRSDADGLERLVREIRDQGGEATGYLLNAAEPDTIEARVAAVEAELGPIDVAVYNLGAQIGDRALAGTGPKAFEMGWRLGTFGLFRLAASMGGRRMLCPTLHAEFAPRGIHVAHIVIEGAVDAPDTLGKMLGPERFAQLREARGGAHDGLMLPAEIANTYFQLARQHRSARTFELDLRAFSDRAWWN